MQSNPAISLSREALPAEEAGSRREQRNTRYPEPDWPCAVECPDGCGAQVWVAGNAQGQTLLLDTFPVADGTGGYVVEPLYVNRAADVEDTTAKTRIATSKHFVEITDAWNWYATYESPLVTSSNSRFGLHLLSCHRKTKMQRLRAVNGQTYGGCCVPRSERSARARAAPETKKADDPTQSVIESDPRGQLYLFGCS